MVTSVLELILQCFKLFFIILTAWMKWKEEERILFEKRMRNMTELLKEAVTNRDESFDEAAYLSNLDWEKKTRYAKYYEAAKNVLSAGSGVNELQQQTVMAMGIKVTTAQKEVVAIILKEVSIDEKSKLIAALLTNQ